MCRFRFSKHNYNMVIVGDVVAYMVEEAVTTGDWIVAPGSNVIWTQAGYAHQHLGMRKYIGDKITDSRTERHWLRLLTYLFNFIAVKKGHDYFFKFAKFYEGIDRDSHVICFKTYPRARSTIAGDTAVLAYI